MFNVFTLRTNNHWSTALLTSYWLIQATAQDLFQMIDVLELLTIHQPLKSTPN